jgi:O-antigen ligase
MSLPSSSADAVAPAASAGAWHRVSSWLTRERTLLFALWALGLMLTLPFLAPFKAPPIASFHPEAIAACCGLAALSVLPRFAASLELPRVALLPLALCLLIVVQLVQGKLVFHEVGLLAALYLLWACALICLGRLLARELGLERVIGCFSWFLMAGAIISAVFGWAQHIESDALGSLLMPRSPIRVWANLGQSNQLADYLALGLISTAYLYATARIKLRWALPALLAVSYVLSLTGSRTSWVYLLALIAVSAIFVAFERSQVHRRLLAFSAGALVAVVVLPWLTGLIAGDTQGIMTATSRLDPEVFAYEERPRIWKAAWMMFQQAPLFGVGLRQFGWQHFVLNAELPAPRVIGVTDQAHNLALQILAELGLVGLALLLVFGFLWLRGLLRQPRTAAHWWLWSCVLVLAVHSMLEYPLWYTFFLGVAALVLGMGEARTIRLSLFQRRSGRWLLVALLGVGWLVLGQLIRDYRVLEEFLAFRYKYMHATPEVKRLGDELLREIRRTSVLSPYVWFGYSRAIELKPEGLREKLAVNTRAMRLFPTDDMVYRQAMLLAMNGDETQARHQWDLAAASFPEDEERARRVVRQRVGAGVSELAPLLEYAQSRLPEPAKQ